MSVPPPAPGGQPPVGQPGPYAPPPGQTGGYLPPPVPVMPRKRQRRGLIIRLTILAVLVVGGGTAAIVSYNTSSDSANAGDCFVFSGGEQSSAPDKVDCNDPKANVKVAVRLDNSTGSCPDELDMTLTSSGRNDYRLCLMVNAKQGDCFNNFFEAPDDSYEKLPCGDPRAGITFVKVSPVYDKSQCKNAGSDRVLAYTTPPTTFCIKTKNAS